MTKLQLPRGIRKRGTKFFVDVSRHGLRRTCTAATLHEALAARERLIDELENGVVPGSEPAPEIPMASKRWTLRQGVDKVKSLPAPEGWAGMNSEKSASIYAEAAVEYFGPTKRLDDIDEDGLDDYVQHLMEEKGNSNSTINKKLSHLSKVFKVAVRKKGVVKKPLFPGRLREAKGRHRFITPKEEATLLGYLRRLGHEHEAELVEVLIDTGCRYSEATNIDSSDVSLKSGVVLIHGRDARGTKNGEFRSVPMTSRVKAALSRRMKEATDPHQPLFTEFDYYGFRRAWNKAKEIMGLGEDAKFTPHVCRHTCASRLVQKGGALKVVQEWLGHKTIQMTMRYAYLYPANLMDAVSALEPDQPQAAE